MPAIIGAFQNAAKRPFDTEKRNGLCLKTEGIKITPLGSSATGRDEVA